MARMKSGLKVTKGKLGDHFFRQQVVKEKGRYVRRTIVATLPESNPSNTPKQSKQRSKFRLIQQIASALTARSVLSNFYYTGSLLGGYQGFIRDHLTNDYAVVESGGNWFVDFKKLRVTLGNSFKKIKAYAAETLVDDDCHCARKLAWDYHYIKDGAGSNSVLQLIGIKVDSDGAIEDIVYEQPMVTMDRCMAEVLLPTCDCCKTYWYAFFVNPVEGTFTTSSYLGTCSCEVEAYDDTCHTCVKILNTEVIVEPPSDCPISCGDTEIDPANIVYNGTSHIGYGNGPNITILVPEENIILDSVCSNVIKPEVAPLYTYKFSSTDNNFTIVTDDTDSLSINNSMSNDDIQSLIASHFNIDPFYVVLEDGPLGGTNPLRIKIGNLNTPLNNFLVTGKSEYIIGEDMSYAIRFSADSDVEIRVQDALGNITTEMNEAIVIVAEGLTTEFKVEGTKNGCPTWYGTFEINDEGLISGGEDNI